MNHKKNIAKVLIIFFIALSLRLYGLNWDQGTHLHPDERFLTMVSADIKLPTSIQNYFDTNNSLLNPVNVGHRFYVYGTLPLLVVKTIAQITSFDGYDKIYLVGRIISAIFDSVTSLIVFYLAKMLFKNKKIAYASWIAYAICVFPIQQSHFFTTDTFLVFFSTLALFSLINFFENNRLFTCLVSGFIFGLAISSKISLIITVPIISLAIASFGLINRKNILSGLLFVTTYILSAFIAFRMFQPYAFDGLFQINTLFKQNIKTASDMISGVYDYPPNVQWSNTIPLLHPLFNMLLFGMGPIIFIVSGLGIIRYFKNNLLTLRPKIIIPFLTIIFWACTIFLYQGILLAKYMRYFYPIYPVLIIFFGYGYIKLSKKIKLISSVLIIFCTTSFLGIYSRPHSRNQASFWIYQNIPENKTISSEEWDDGLPYSSSFYSSNKIYQNISLSLYQPDSDPNKWPSLEKKIDSADYLIMSSDRLWSSISKNQIRYPVSSVFYQNLFKGNSQFELINHTASYPGFSLSFMKSCIYVGPTKYPGVKTLWLTTDQTCLYPGIYFRDDIAEESFTVYDHPQVLIFKNKLSH